MLRLALLVDGYPKLSETFVVNELAALRALGHDVRVEARVRAATPNPEADVSVPAAFYLEDGTLSSRLRATARLVARHPVRCARDLLARRVWRAEESVLPLRVLAPVALRLRRHGVEHLHVHFATGPALDALRLARILDLSWSVIGHGWDVFQEPRNLARKLRDADLVLAPCEYTARAMRAAAPGVDVRVVVMGVDARRFSRTTPPPGGRTVLAVGRLVEKKGFEVLDAAAARLPDVRVRIVGEGPSRERLHHVELLGALPPEEVRRALEEADVLAMPCVVARDGDRDAMPVVVKEALAMEVPVVASDEVGLPELVRPPWGRLVPPGDAAALASAIEELLALPVEERAAAGRAGRAFVEEHCDVARETAKLSALLPGRETGASARARS